MYLIVLVDSSRSADSFARQPAASSEARKTTTGAISSGLPNLAPSGVAATSSFAFSLPTNPTTAIVPSVSMAWGDSVDADIAWSEFFGQCHCESVDRAFGCRIERRVRHGILAGN